MRAFLPFLSTLEEFFSIVEVPAPFTQLVTLINTVVRALTLARDHQITSRNSHYQCRFHFFWEHIGHRISVEYVKSEHQDSDYLTKGLVRAPFEANRYRVQGW